MFYTYLHRRESDNQPFYIGKGKDKRAWAHKGRNDFWKRTVAKHGLKVEIVAEWKNEEDAFEHEKFLIACFKDMGCNLVNLTDGGDGPSGMTHSDEVRQKISIANKGIPKSQDHRSKIGAAHIGMIRSDETRKKISDLAKSRFESTDARLKMSKIAKERMSAKAVRENISRKLKERLSDPAIRERMSEITKAQMQNPETIEKLRVAARKQMQIPENRMMSKDGAAKAWLTEEYRAKRAATCAANPKSWINDGKSSKMISKNLPLPEGFVYGRLSKVSHV